MAIYFKERALILFHFVFDTDLKAMIESAKNLSMEASLQNRGKYLTNQCISSCKIPLKLMIHLLPTDLQDQVKAVSSKKSATCVPVFSVENCTNPSASSGQSFGFTTFVVEAETEHGEFDLSSGIYTVKTSGIYQLNFNAYVYLVSGVTTHQFDLKVNGETVAISYNYSASTGNQPAVISDVLPLDAGDEVGIFANRGKLCQDRECKTRFFGILLNPFDRWRICFPCLLFMKPKSFPFWLLYIRWNFVYYKHLFNQLEVYFQWFGRLYTNTSGACFSDRVTFILVLKSS